MLCRIVLIVNTSHQRHYSGYVLIFAFWDGVLKDCEAPFSLNYVRLKNYLNLRSYVVTYSLLSASVVELINSRNLTRLKHYANWIHRPSSQVSFI